MKKRIKRFMIFLAIILPVCSLNAQNKSISIKAENMPIKEVLKSIESQTDYTFSYNNGQVKTDLKISENFSNMKVTDILDKVLKPNGINYVVQGKQIILSDVKNSGVTQQTQRSGLKLSGRVIDRNGEALPGVTIQIAGTTRGVITDENGNFEMENIAVGVNMIAAFVGMQNKEFTFDGKSSMIIVMEENVNELDEVTIVAFGKQKKESVIASISSINTKDLKIPSSNLTTALAGRISGLISYQRSGEPGQDDASFFVRGVTSFAYKAAPLILIDGVEMSSSDLARLQPDDIASFSIMKDAAATALYGARGANGVILVTTKEGREGKASVSVRYETSISKPTQNVKIVDPTTYMQMNNEAVQTRNPMSAVPYPYEKIDNTIAGKNKYVYPATDWYDILFQNQTVNHRVNFNVSGGGKISRYYIAGTFNQDNGILNVDGNNNFNNNIDLKKYLLRSNVNINVTPTTEAVIRLHGTFDDYTGPLDGGSDLYRKVMRSDPVLFPPYYEPDEKYSYVNHTLFGNYDNGQYINPYADMVKGYKDYAKSLMSAQFEIRQKLDFITKGLSVRGLLNTNRYSYFDVRRSYVPFWYKVTGYDKYSDEYALTRINPAGGTEWLGYSEGQKEITSTTYMEAALNYDRTFKERHTLSGLLVGVVRNSLQPNASTLALSLPSRNVGLSGRFTYSYDSRYFSEFNFGYNGSERFAKKERFGFFPSVGAAWIISNEPFFDDFSRTISKLKLKATYGLVGNDAIGDANDRFFYLSEVNLNSTGRAFTWGENYNAGHTLNGVATSRYANDKITWETSTKTNLGIEIDLFNKLEIQADFYTEYRENILMSRADIPTTMGLQATPMTNVGEASGKGVDLSLDYNQSFNQYFWITGRVNFTYATAKYEVYEEVDNSLTPWLSRIGYPISQRQGYVAERLFVDDVEVINSPTQTFGEYMGGDIKYRDINGDDQINSLDQVFIGYPTEPEIIYGFGFSSGYRNLDLACFFQGLGRESFWIDVNATSPFIDNDGNSALISKNAMLQVYADSHWSEDNRDVYSLWPRLAAKDIPNNAQTSTWFMRDGSFLRLKSIELGYTIPKRLISPVGFENLRFYFSGVNMLTFSKFKLWDPEMAGDGLGYPVQKVFNIGVQVAF